MRPKKMTRQFENELELEAERRAQRMHRSQRITNKQLAELGGLKPSYIAQLISRKRRALEMKINVPHETSTFSASNVNS